MRCKLALSVVFSTPASLHVAPHSCVASPAHDLAVPWLFILLSAAIMTMNMAYAGCCHVTADLTHYHCLPVTHTWCRESHQDSILSTVNTIKWMVYLDMHWLSTVNTIKWLVYLDMHWLSTVISSRLMVCCHCNRSGSPSCSFGSAGERRGRSHCCHSAHGHHLFWLC